MQRRFALVQTVLLVSGVIVALPLALRSMSTLLTDEQSRLLYNFPGGQVVTDDSAAGPLDAESLIEIAAIELDEATGSVTLAISGHRTCSGACPRLNLAVFSLEDDASARRALPPYARLTLEPDDLLFSQTVKLPVRGQPIRYPFDNYSVWLGVAGITIEEGALVPLTTNGESRRLEVTTQNLPRDLLMAPPAPIDPVRVQALPAPYEFLGVQEIVFSRPAYPQILPVLLVVLIAVSAILAVAMWEVSNLIVGLGSLVIGIWGVRSILVPRPFPTVTSVDLVLLVVILLVLLGLSFRAAWHLQRQSELPPLHLRRRRN